MNCGCDEQLAYTLSNLAPTVYNDDFNNFDHAKECKATNGTGGSAGIERECCGTYPNRFQYMPQGGARSCCGEVTYNTSQHDCCDGEVKDSGTCETGF